MGGVVGLYEFGAASSARWRLPASTDTTARMRVKRSRGWVLACAATIATPAWRASGAGSEPQAPVDELPVSPKSETAGFELQQVADGVYVALRQEAPGLWFDANNTFIVDDEGVIVVDANISAASTRAVLAALRKLTDKPVRYV